MVNRYMHLIQRLIVQGTLKRTEIDVGTSLENETTYLTENGKVDRIAISIIYNGKYVVFIKRGNEYSALIDDELIPINMKRYSEAEYIFNEKRFKESLLK